MDAELLVAEVKAPAENTEVGEAKTDGKGLYTLSAVTSHEQLSIDMVLLSHWEDRSIQDGETCYKVKVIAILDSGLVKVLNQDHEVPETKILKELFLFSVRED